MSVEIRIIREGLPIRDFLHKQLEEIELIKKEVDELGEKTRDKMKEIIQQSKKRNQAGEPTKLEDAITVEHFENGWGVGNIDKLNKEAPHWHWINFGKAQSGRTIPPGTDEFPRLKGYFDPETMGRFKKGSPWYPIFPKKPIAPMNYIERTANWLYEELKKLISKRK